MQVDSQTWVTQELATRQTTETRSLGMIVATAVLGMLVLLVLRHPDVWGANDESRWNTIYSLGEQGTYQIDHTPWIGTADKVHLNGHFYSSKPPVLPTLMAGEYFVLNKLTGGALALRSESLLGGRLNRMTAALTGYPGRSTLVIPVLLILTNLVPFALYLMLFARLIEQLSSSTWVRQFTMVAVALGTFVTSFQVTLNNHTVGALCFFFALYQAYEILCEERREGWRLAVAGLFASLAAVTELAAVIIPALLLFAFARHCRWQVLWWFVPFALLPFVAHFWTNHLVTGGWMPAYVNKGAYLYPGSPWTMNAAGNLVINNDGIDGQWESWWVYCLHNLIGHHGWFSLTPVLVLAGMGALRVAVRGRQWYRLFALSSMLLLVYLLVIYTFFTGHRNYGGTTAGSRYLFWIIPIWLMFLPAGLNVLAHRRSLRLVALVLLMISTATVIHAAIDPWADPWFLEMMRQMGVVRY